MNKCAYKLADMGHSCNYDIIKSKNPPTDVLVLLDNNYNEPLLY